MGRILLAQYALSEYYLDFKFGFIIFGVGWLVVLGRLGFWVARVVFFLSCAFLFPFPCFQVEGS